MSIGFTQILGLTFDNADNLYVLEYAVKSQATPNNNLFGSLIRIAPNGSRTTIIGADGTLIAPTHIALGPEGKLYVANKGIFAGQGEVISLDIKDVPEPNFSLSMIIFGAAGLAWQLRRHRFFQ